MPRNLIGKVVSDKMEKTVVIAVERIKSHPVYRKNYTVTKKFKVHDEENSAHVGDTVEVQETRPISKEKRWRLVKVVEKAKIRE